MRRGRLSSTRVGLWQFRASYLIAAFLLALTQCGDNSILPSAGLARTIAPAEAAQFGDVTFSASFSLSQVVHRARLRFRDAGGTWISGHSSYAVVYDGVLSFEPEPRNVGGRRAFPFRVEPA